jgi:hypothetical protein
MGTLRLCSRGLQVAWRGAVVFSAGDLHFKLPQQHTICAGLYFFMGLPASLQSEFSLTPADTKNAGQVNVNLVGYQIAENRYEVSP